MALKNTQYDVIMRAYEQKQLRNRNRQMRRYEKAYHMIPQLKEVDDAISALSVWKARQLLEGEQSALSSLKEEIQSFIEQRHRLLLEGGFSADYLEMTYECPDCKDTGYIGNKKCHCFKKATIDLLYAQSNLKNILQKENFHTFNLTYYSKNFVDPKTGRTSFDIAKAALQTCHDFTDHFSKQFENLLLYGDTGIGKTFLANCIAKELMDKTYSVIYFTAFELFDVFAKSKFQKDASADVMYDHIFNCDLLIIDDLGTELANSFTVSQLFLCLNERILRQKSTIISTNLSLESIVELYSERTFSRITSHYTMLRLAGDDIRIKKKLLINN